MSKDINDLHPELQKPCNDFFDKSREDGLDTFLIFTWRSPEDQDKIYAQGRTAPGKIVTQLKGDRSLHCFTLNGQPAAKAFDFGLRDENNKYILDGSDHRYLQAGVIGKSLGLEWGGDWRSFKDYSHFQIKE